MDRNNHSRHSGESRNPYARKHKPYGSRIARLCRLSGMTIMVFALPAMAAEEKTPVTYSPEYCEFAVTFPGEPYKTEKCEGEDKKKCFEQTTYTQVYDLSSTVNFRVVCNKIDESVRQTYSGAVMEKTLKAMTEKTVVKTFETSFREEEKYKQAGLVGEGKVGRLATIYIAQLWIGDTSAFSVEAELIGAENHDADVMFSEVLKSVHFKADRPQEEAAAEDAKEEEKDSEAEEPKEEAKDSEAKTDEPKADDKNE